ncbi:Holliday junction resolvase [Pseudidiomarina atlantica]|jgi:putative Holliday junction resolvase|uniref:Putative pre-16S rRNA nuclease n=1 Tax=Pseudidiomarina atlantica TaxID=1517416 RepID=A0A094J7B6_9GAMM|nr:Holliday junction resolvase RuvX [Pseudidiomarina atlantica]KFZ28496.1 Holliday junction resolvase [Pseudidiomarina atlantica]
MSQVLGFDFGTHNIGVAVGQSITGTASPLAALKAKDGQPDWLVVEKLIKEWQPKLLVVGLPLNMDGSEQALTDLARKFANRLHGRFGLPVELQDERLTTVAAKEELFARGGFRELSKDKIDSAAAQLILEDYLAHHSL